MFLCIQQAILTALKHLPEFNEQPASFEIPVEYSRSPEHGDFSSSIALVLAKQLGKPPRKLAETIASHLQDTTSQSSTLFSHIEVAGAGFINFFLQPDAWYPTLSDILTQEGSYGHKNIGNNKRILVEFVSSNPTGPLHVGHGRGAAQGDILVRLLKRLGYNVSSEYYINDAGRQMDILACSIWLRYLESRALNLVFPINAYQGDYIRKIADKLTQDYAWALSHPLPSNIDQPLKSNDPEKSMDSLINHIKDTLGPQKYADVFNCGLQYILDDIQSDLKEFDVTFDRWFSERSLIDNGAVTQMINTLIERGHTYQIDGTLWFRSTHFKDDKDRVLLRANGQPTYFAVDAAYRLNILRDRGFEEIINLVGADHHGYLARIHAVIQALGYKKESIIFSTLQLVSLFRGTQKLALSTRSGEFITLKALRTEVGNDAARLFFVLRRSSQTIDFDLELAKSHSHHNPVYYLQYAYARICSLTAHLDSKNLNWDRKEGLTQLHRLTQPAEIQLIKQLSRYSEALQQSASQYEPAILVHYLRELAKQFHSYYNSTPILTEETALRNARFTLVYSVRQVLKNGFEILGIQAPERM